MVNLDTDEMVEMAIKIPKIIAKNIDPKTKRLTNTQYALLLRPLVDDLTISNGRAAEIIGMRKWDLIELYGELGYPYLNLSKEAMEKEINAEKKLFFKKSISVFNELTIA